MTKRVSIYARVSTGGQTVEDEVVELTAVAERQGWEVVATFVDDGVVGAKGREHRPGFDRLLEGVQRRDFDMIATWSVDRLGRSLTHLVSFLGDIQAKKVDLYLHQQGLDTSTPSGRAVFGMAGVFADFERGMIVERVKAGIARAQRDGPREGKKAIGRPRKSDVSREAIAEALHQGMSIRGAAQLLGVAPNTVMAVKRRSAADRLAHQ